MRKKMMTMGIAIIMLFSFVVFAGGRCVIDDSYDISVVRENARRELVEYVGSIRYYPIIGTGIIDNGINGPAIDKIVHEGKIAINNAPDKESIELALYVSKRKLDAIPIIFLHERTSGFLLIFPYENAVFDARTNDGVLQHGRFGELLKSGQNLTFEFLGDMCRNGKMLTTVDWGRDFNIPLLEHAQYAFIEIIIRIDDDIIGYMVIEGNLHLCFLTSSSGIPVISFSSRLLSLFSPVNDNGFQILDEEEVKASIESTKNQFRR